MDSSRDSNIWRSLAIAFGDGLAFGVGMKLTQAAGRQIAASGTASHAMSDRLDRIEHSVKSIERAPSVSSAAADQKVLDAIVSALEARLHEQTGQVDRRLADLDARIAIELNALDQQDRTLSQRVSDDITAIKEQIAALHREFSIEVARFVAEQVASQVASRVAAATTALEQRVTAQLAAEAEGRAAADEAAESRITEHVTATGSGIEQRVDERLAAEAAARAAADEAAESRIAAHVSATAGGIQQHVEERLSAEASARATADQELEGRVTAAVASALDERLSAVHARLEPIEQRMREEVDRKDREIVELRQRIADTDTNVLELILGISQMCRRAAQQISPPENPLTSREPNGSAGAGPTAVSYAQTEPAASAAPEESPETDMPGFAQPQQPNRLWRVPLVSSVVFAMGSLLLRHYLL